MQTNRSNINDAEMKTKTIKKNSPEMKVLEETKP